MRPTSFAASPVLAIGHFRFDGLAEEVECPKLPFHYISVALGGPLVIEARLGGEKVKGRVLPGQSLIMAAERSNVWRWDRPTEEAHVFLHADFLDRIAAEAGNGRADISDRLAFTDTPLRHTILGTHRRNAAPGSISPLFFDMAADVIARRILFRHCQKDGKAVANAAGALTARQLRRMLSLVEDRLSEDISLDDLAGAAGLSRFHFVRAFKRPSGRRPTVGSSGCVSNAPRNCS